MTARTMAQHTPGELRYAGCDEAAGLVFFQADSKSQPGKVNTVALDATTGACHCDCTAATVGLHSCWHADLAPLAWAAHPAMQEVRWLSDARLEAYGRKLGAMVRTYAARIGQVLPMDAVNLTAARCEYRRRAARAAHPVPALVVPSPATEYREAA